MAKEIKKDEIAELKQKRREDAEAKKASKKIELDQREEFRKYFAKISSKLKLEKSMENVLWLHFKSAGFAEKEKFTEGLNHFGYKI